MGETFESTYRWYIAHFGQSPLMIDVAGGMCLSVAVFWTIGTAYTVLDLTGWPATLHRYRTQDKTVTFADVKRTVKIALLNQFGVQLLTTILYHFALRYRGSPSPHEPIPSVGAIFVHIAAFAAIQETLFYYSHRLLHWGPIYRYVHKMHHRWQAPIAIAAIYCHPIEHVVANLFPVLAGPLLLASHRAIILIWLVIIHCFALMDHSGYHFPLMPSPEFHDYHHLVFNQNFGRMGLLDYWHGTSKRYYRSKQFPRHRVLLSTTPIRQQEKEQAILDSDLIRKIDDKNISKSLHEKQPVTKPMVPVPQKRYLRILFTLLPYLTGRLRFSNV